MSDTFVIVNGSSYQLFKLGTSPTAAWRVRVQHQGTRRSMSTGTRDLDQAKVRAIPIVESALAGNWESFESLRTGAPRPPVKMPTFAKLFEAARSLPVASAPLYVMSCERLVCEALDVRSIGRLTLDVLTAPLVRSFQAKRQGFKTAKPDKATAANGGANAALSNARCLFSVRAIAHYERLGLNIPDMRPFMEAPYLIAERPRYSDNIISNDTLAKIDAALPTESEQVKAALSKVRLKGAAPGALERNELVALQRFLKRWELSPIDIHHHAGLAMYRRTGSLHVAADFMGVSLTTAEYHFSEYKVKVSKLTVCETYL